MPRGRGFSSPFCSCFLSSGFSGIPRPSPCCTRWPGQVSVPAPWRKDQLWGNSPAHFGTMSYQGRLLHHKGGKAILLIMETTLIVKSKSPSLIKAILSIKCWCYWNHSVVSSHKAGYFGDRQEAHTAETLSVPDGTPRRCMWSCSTSLINWYWFLYFCGKKCRNSERLIICFEVTELTQHLR